VTRLFVHQLGVEQKVFWRNRESAVFVFIFPIMLFVLLASVYGGTTTIDGVTRPAKYALLAGLLSYGAANTAFAGLAITLVIRREAGLLKRLRSTPLPAPAYLAAVVASLLVVFALQTLSLFVIGRVVFGTRLPHNVASLVVLVLIGVAGFGGVGFGVTSLIRSAEGSSAVVNVILLPMAFLSGSFGPARHLPKVLGWVADVLPLRYFVQLANAIYLKGEHVWSKPGAIAVVLGWGAGGLVVAARRFRWEPRDR
jgi:ABC-2 type transport system permease protein